MHSSVYGYFYLPILTYLLGASDEEDESYSKDDHQNKEEHF